MTPRESLEKYYEWSDLKECVGGENGGGSACRAAGEDIVNYTGG